MTLEERKDNTYYDKKGRQILERDLLKIFHFKIRNRNYYMYHVVVMDDQQGEKFMACKDYYKDKPHYCLSLITQNRIYKDAEIIAEKDWETKRLKIKVK